MCGIAGFFDFRGQFSETVNEIIEGMSQVIQHRGPDHQGLWISQDKRLAMGHRRLSILDLTSEGNQPMVSHSGRYVIVFNGEIYNFKSLRDQLKNKNLRGSSDTEILLQTIEEKGLNHTLQSLEGMFAFALLDKENNKLFLVRDRLGEKPLYFAIHDGILIFASELKSLKYHPGFRKELDTRSAALYFQYGYVPGSNSIYKGVSKILPGELIEFSLSGSLESKNRIYWDLSLPRGDGENTSDFYNLLTATDELEELLLDVLSKESISDVSLGSFLSGGIDSSLITALLQKVSSSAVETFSIGYEEDSHNEAPYASKIATHLGTKHNELILSARDLIDTIPSLQSLFDEPFGDSSSVPTYLVSKFAKTKLTVCLSGDGGDELFGGYSRYQRANTLWGSINSFPYPLRRLTNMPFNLLSKYETNSELYQKFIKALEYLNCNSLEECYELQLKFTNTEMGYFTNISEINSSIPNFQELNLYKNMLYRDLKLYLPDDILTKVDRAAMSNSLETRAPFLHHKVVEFASDLPMKMKTDGITGKIILRELLSRYIPRELFERPKMGFGIPINHWLRNDLKGWATDLLNKENLERSGLLKSHLIQRRLKEHLEGKRNWDYFLWRILMFIDWQEINLNKN